MTTGFIETHRSFVNSWECDENVHMNVQFYLKRFDEAARFFRLLAGDGNTGSPLPHTRHVRYHSELRMAQLTVTSSAQVLDGPLTGHVVHFMRESMTGRLCATAIDAPDGSAYTVAVASANIPEALPRSIPVEPQIPLSGQAMLDNGGIISHRCMVHPGECDRNGEMLEQFHISRFTDGAPHVWDHAGLGTKWLNENGFGRVAVEMKITHHNPARAGDAVALHSSVSAVGAKTIRLHHELVDARDGKALASGDVIALVMDLKTRKAVEMPSLRS